MKYDFDTVVNRYHTNSLKYDCAAQWDVPTDAIPMWVADMDFRTAPEILEAMHACVEHGIFGYSVPREEYHEIVANWFRDRLGWKGAKGEWIVKTPGVVFAIATAIRAFTEKGDAVLIQQPVYYPFRMVIEDNERICINNPLVFKDGRYEMDFADMEQKIVDNHVKMFLLCSPHNPVGRVWTKEELKKVIAICKRHDVLIVSDEIHCDFVYPGFEHTMLPVLAVDYTDHMIVCTAPSKSFNLAGLQLSHIFIPSESMRRTFQKELMRIPYDESGTLALVAGRAAYEKGAQWMDELKEYLLGNLYFMRDFLKTNLPKVRFVEPEGTYLVWLDFSAYDMTPEELEHKMHHEAKLWLDEGTMFGEEGAMFERVNIACPRITLKRALEQMAATFAE